MWREFRNNWNDVKETKKHTISYYRWMEEIQHHRTRMVETASNVWYVCPFTIYQYINWWFSWIYHHKTSPYSPGIRPKLHGMYAKNDNDPSAVITRTLKIRQRRLGGVCVWLVRKCKDAGMRPKMLPPMPYSPWLTTSIWNVAIPEIAACCCQIKMAKNDQNIVCVCVWYIYIYI